jgi:hypothetical protein
LGKAERGGLEASGEGAVAMGLAENGNLHSSAKGSIALGYNVQALGEATVTLGKDIICSDPNTVCVNDLNAANGISAGNEVIKIDVIIHTLSAADESNGFADISWNKASVANVVGLEAVGDDGSNIVNGTQNNANDLMADYEVTRIRVTDDWGYWVEGDKYKVIVTYI